MPTLIPSSEDVRIYEIAVMIEPDLAPAQEKKVLTEVEALFTEAQAKLIFKDSWSKRGIAYPIKGFKEAKYVIYYHEMDPSKIRELDTALRITKGVLRHLVVIPPKGYEAVSYEDRYQDWLKNRETVSDARNREKEEKAKQSVIEKAKRETKRLATKKPAKEEAKPMAKEKLDSEIEKLISDSDLQI